YAHLFILRRCWSGEDAYENEKQCLEHNSHKFLREIPPRLETVFFTRYDTISGLNCNAISESCAVSSDRDATVGPRADNARPGSRGPAQAVPIDGLVLSTRCAPSEAGLLVQAATRREAAMSKVRFREQSITGGASISWKRQV